MKEMSQMSKISAPQMAYPYNEKIINEIKYFIAFSALKKLLKQEKISLEYFHQANVAIAEKYGVSQFNI